MPSGQVETDMPWQEVMHKFKHGTLHSGSKKGPKVRSREQAMAILSSEKKKETHASLRGLKRAAK